MRKKLDRLIDEKLSNLNKIFEKKPITWKGINTSLLRKKTHNPIKILEKNQPFVVKFGRRKISDTIKNCITFKLKNFSYLFEKYQKYNKN